MDVFFGEPSDIDGTSYDIARRDRERGTTAPPFEDERNNAAREREKIPQGSGDTVVRR